MSWPELIPPWDQAKYFQRSIETAFASISSVIQVAEADPSRVALIFTASGDFAVAISINQTVALGQGHSLIPGNLPLILTHALVGPLVQYQWFAVGYGESSNLTVTAVTLSQWPQICQST